MLPKVVIPKPDNAKLGVLAAPRDEEIPKADELDWPKVELVERFPNGEVIPPPLVDIPSDPPTSLGPNILVVVEANGLGVVVSAICPNIPLRACCIIGLKPPIFNKPIVYQWLIYILGKL